MPDRVEFRHSTSSLRLGCETGSRNGDRKPSLTTARRWSFTCSLTSPSTDFRRSPPASSTTTKAPSCAKASWHRMRSINKTITRLAQVLEVAVEYKQLEHNPAKGKRRRVKGTKRSAPGSSPSSFSACSTPPYSLRPLVATTAGGGLRVGEAIALPGPTSTSAPPQSLSGVQEDGGR